MTAEVAILNANAVALAADSAVTVGSQKIYNSAIKLFALSKSAPVAVMIYGNANLMEIPWELVIKLYRKQLGTNTFKTTEDYARDLIEFVQRHSEFLTKESGESWLITRTLSYWLLCRQDAEKLIREELEQNPKGVSEARIYEVFRSAFLRRRESLERLNDLDISMVVIDEASNQVRVIIDRFGHEWFGEIIKLEGFRELAVEIGTLLFKKDIFPESSSGVVVAGFGEEQIFPSVAAYEIEGGPPGYLRHNADPDKSHAVSQKMPAGIIPFAQDDMVATFMEGINPGFGKFVLERISDIFNNLPDALAGNIGKSKKQVERIKSGLQKLCTDLHNDVLSTLDSHRYREHVNPVLQMVAVLPKNELAEMAETLVNLTAFKRRVTHSLESVGGPVDVCVISKGDGLVWVRRKHYFPPELNHLFFRNYMRDVA